MRLNRGQKPEVRGQKSGIGGWRLENNKKKKWIIVITITILFITIFKFTGLYNIILKQFYPMKYSEYVEKYAKEYNVDNLLIYSIIKAESNFNEKAISASNAKGLMQLMDKTAEEVADNLQMEYEEKDIYEPEKNIMLGTKYYSELLKKYNDNMYLALAAYNAGIGNVNNWIETGTIKEDGSDIENIPFKETNMYVRKIINNYRMYKKIWVIGVRH